MNTTKTGLSPFVLACLVFCIAAFGGYTATILVACYIFMNEDSAFLKKVATRAITLLIICSVITFGAGIIVDVLSTGLEFIADLVDKYDFYETVYNVKSSLNNGLSHISTVFDVIFLVYAGLSLKGKEVKLPLIEKNETANK